MIWSELIIWIWSISKKKRKTREERWNEGATIKFLLRSDRSDETAITVEGYSDDVVNEVQLEKKTEEEVGDDDPPQTNEEQHFNINLKV